MILYVGIHKKGYLNAIHSFLIHQEKKIKYLCAKQTIQTRENQPKQGI